jgi:hypothetical protein
MSKRYRKSGKQKHGKSRDLFEQYREKTKKQAATRLEKITQSLGEKSVLHHKGSIGYEKGCKRSTPKADRRGDCGKGGM